MDSPSSSVKSLVARQSATSREDLGSKTFSLLSWKRCRWNFPCIESRSLDGSKALFIIVNNEDKLGKLNGIEACWYYFDINITLKQSLKNYIYMFFVSISFYLGSFNEYFHWGDTG